MLSPLLLRPDNFTPLTRTPWAGEMIVRQLKPFLVTADAPVAVGESWELSTGPAYPSRLLASGQLLGEVLAQQPAAYLGWEARHWQTATPGTALLVKLLNADQPLSVQIHPDDDYPGLRTDESGKPEAWYVVAREPGAGVFIGWRDGVSERDVRHALQHGTDVSQLLCFVPVALGDFFVIPPGTPHAVGPGLTLVEPQQVIPGKQGLTYRYWDWQRRYDANGLPSAQGLPRTLHLDDAIATTNWSQPREAALLKLLHKRAGAADLHASPTFEPLCGPTGGVESRALQVWRVAGTGTCPLPPADGLRALTALAGQLELLGPWGRCRLPAGYTAALPATLAETTVRAQGAHALLSAIAHPRRR